MAAVIPDAVLFNYHPVTMAWADDPRLTACGTPRFALLHETYQSTADKLKPGQFDFMLCPDPTLLPHNPMVIVVPRFIPQPRAELSVHPEIFTVGSFGFATPGKGFERLCSLVNAEFDRARIRLHLPPHDNEAIIPRVWFDRLVDACQKRITKPGITLDISEEFLDESALLDFLSENTVNAFLYDDSRLGISSCTDYALASGRPVAVSGSAMFRNLHGVNPSISIENRRLSDIAATGITPLRHHIAQYAPEAASSAWCDAILAALEIRDTCQSVPDGRGFNKILDDRSRVSYSRALEDLQYFAPEILARKIKRTHIQQAFALDSVERLTARYQEPRILAVGSFEDTAVAALRAKGFRLDELDPNVNRIDLQAFASSATTVGQSYDLVLCVSVLEHVADDRRFIRSIADLLAPGGIAVLTVDFSNNYIRPGRNPSLDERLYTTADLNYRLMSVLPECGLLDLPTWDEAKDEFTYDGRDYASLVFRKFYAPTLRYAIPAIVAQRVSLADASGLPLINALRGFGDLFETMYTKVGQKQVEAGAPVFFSDGSTPGYLAFGPYCPCSPGIYDAAFMIKVATADLAAHAKIAVLDAVLDGIPIQPAKYCVYGDFILDRFFIVPFRFTITAVASQLETRLWVNVSIKVTVVAAVAIVRVAE